MKEPVVSPKLEQLFKKVDAARDEIDDGQAQMLKLSGELLQKERELRHLITKIRSEMDGDRERRHRLSDHYYKLTEELHRHLEAHIATNARATRDLHPTKKKDTP